jgi:hypothetical protein
VSPVKYELGFYITEDDTLERWLPIMLTYVQLTPFSVHNDQVNVFLLVSKVLSLRFNKALRHILFFFYTEISHETNA